MIRRATIEDIPSIVQCMRRFYDGSSYDSTGLNFDMCSVGEFCTRLISNDNACLIIAVDGDSVVGFITGVVAPWSLDNSQMLASELGWWMDIEYRGRSDSVRLLREYERWAKDAGATRCMMAHLEDDRSGRMERFYQKTGYLKAESHYMKGL